MSALLEFFTLRGAKELATKITPETRTEIEHALRLGRQKAQAAEALWSNGSIAEALRLASQGIAVTTDSLAGSDPSRSPGFEIVREMLMTGGLSKRRIDSIEAASELRKTFTLPALDEEAPAESTEVFRRWVESETRVYRTLESALLSPGRRRLRLIFRAAVAAIGLFVLGGLLAYPLMRAPEDAVQASGFFDSNGAYTPPHAIDGNEASWWIAPDGATAWLEVQLGRPRHVRQVRVMNSTAPPWNDRGTKDYTIEVYGSGRLLRTIRGTFSTESRPRWTTHAIGANNVERVRFTARTWYNKGAAIAEIKVE